ncbi:MAG: lipid II flippase MurJ [Bryobacteraceae bacterium]
MYASVFWLTALAFVSPLTGFLLEMMLARRFGATAELDAYRVGQSLYMMGAGMIVAQLLPHVILPAFLEMKERHGELAAWQGFLAILAILGGAEAALLGVTALWPAVIGHWIAPGLAPAGQASLPTLLFAQALAQAALVCCGAAGVVFTAYQVFVVGALPQILLNLFTLAALDLLRTPMTRSLATGLAVGAAVALLLHAVWIVRLSQHAGVTFATRPRLDVLRGLGIVRGILAPLTVSVGLAHLANLVMQNSLSLQTAGSMALFGYAFRLTALVHLPLSSYANVIFPKLSSALAQQGFAAIVEPIQTSLWRMFWGGAVVAALLWAVRAQVTAVLFGRGALSAADLDRVSLMFGIFLVGAPTGSLATMLHRTFAALRAGRVLVVSGAVMLALTWFSVDSLSASFGAPGIAIAWTLAMWGQVAFLAAALAWRKS